MNRLNWRFLKPSHCNFFLGHVKFRQMQYKIPKNSDKYHWTNHAVQKMRYYGLSENRVTRVIKFPKRKEAGVAPETVAVMQPAGSKNHPYEIWTMYKELNVKKKIIISAWKYPGVSPMGKKIPIPEEIKMELEQILQEI